MTSNHPQSKSTRLQVIALSLTVATLFGGVVYKYTALEKAVAANAENIQKSDAKAEEAAKERITPREWQELLDRLTRIEEKVDKFQWRPSPPRRASFAALRASSNPHQTLFPAKPSP